MTFTKSWDESDPDGDKVRISGMDDAVRDAKAAIRERLEGDSSDPYSGIFEAGSFANSARVRLGSARAFSVLDADIATLPKIAGGLAFSSDKAKLYHLLPAGIIEVSYVNLDGSRAMTGNLQMGGKKVIGMAKGTASGDAAEWLQSAIVDQQRTVTGFWNFSRGSGQAPFGVASGAAKVANLDADKLDGHDASDFVLTTDINSVPIAKAVFNAQSFGTSFVSVGDLDLVLPQSGSWVFRYSLGVQAGGAYTVQIIGASLAFLQWQQDGVSGASAATFSASGNGTPRILQVSGLVSGVAGATISLQFKAAAGTGSVTQGSTCIAVKV